MYIAFLLQIYAWVPETFLSFHMLLGWDDQITVHEIHRACWMQRGDEKLTQKLSQKTWTTRLCKAYAEMGK